MKYKAALSAALLGAGILVALAFAMPQPQVVGTSVVPSAAFASTAGIAPSDEVARDVPTPEELLAFGFHRCKPTLRHPCVRRHHRDRIQG